MLRVIRISLEFKKHLFIWKTRCTFVCMNENNIKRLLTNIVIKEILVEDFNNYVLYTGLKNKENTVVGRTTKNRIKRLYLSKKDSNEAELLEGVEYNQFQVSVYKKIIVRW